MIINMFVFYSAATRNTCNSFDCDKNYKQKFAKNSRFTTLPIFSVSKSQPLVVQFD